MVNSTYTLMTGPINVVRKYLSMSYLCGQTMANNAACSPLMAPVSTMTLIATASSTAVAPSCAWSCSPCGQVTIDGSDGLPVELMDFTIEDGDESPTEGKGPPSSSVGESSGSDDRMAVEATESKAATETAEAQEAKPLSIPTRGGPGQESARRPTQRAVLQER